MKTLIIYHESVVNLKYIILRGDYRSLHGVMINSSENVEDQKELSLLLKEAYWEIDFSEQIYPLEDREIDFIAICGILE